jgi:DNA-binding PadR family transcriptional regulator
MTRKRKIDILTLIMLLEKVRTESKKQRLTTTRILRLTRAGSLHTLYAYVRFACENGFMRVVPVWDGRPYGPAKYYYLTAAGERLLRVWKQRRA